MTKWRENVNTLVRCQRCKRRAIVKLSSYDPSDPPVCQFPDELELGRCEGALTVLDSEAQPSSSA